VLADAAGERQRIDATHDGGVRTDVFTDAVRVEPDGQATGLVAGGGALLDCSRMSADPVRPFSPGALD
jgi:hypothetical protein